MGSRDTSATVEAAVVDLFSEWNKTRNSSKKWSVETINDQGSRGYQFCSGDLSLWNTGDCFATGDPNIAQALTYTCSSQVVTA